MRPIIFTILFFLFLSSYVEAEFYRYTDENGTVRFTDDLGVVPEAQRPEAKEYQAVETKAASGEPVYGSAKPSKDLLEAESENESESEIDDSAFDEEEQSDGIDGEGNAHGLDAEYKRLEKKRDSLTREYEGILKERELLNREFEGELTQEQIDARNKKVRAFNEKVMEYRDKRNSFEKESAEYNIKAIEKMEQTLEEDNFRESEELMGE